MYQSIYTTHKIVVVLFLLIYLIKTILLLANKTEQLAKFSRLFKIPEMIVSFLFLASGIYMLTQQPEINKLMIFKLIAVFASIPLAIIGFKKSSKALAVLSLLLIFAAYALAEINKGKNTKTKKSAGNEIYSELCTRCHGIDGKLGKTGATDLSISNIGEQDIFTIIKNGKGDGVMPAFNKLNDEQITAVAKYLQELRK